MSKPSGKGSSRRQDDQDSLGESVPYESLPQTLPFLETDTEISSNKRNSFSLPSPRSVQAGTFQSLNAPVSRVQPSSLSPTRVNPSAIKKSGENSNIGKIPGFRPGGVAVPSPADPEPARSVNSTPSRQPGSGTLHLSRAAVASRLSLIPDDPVAESIEAKKSESQQSGNPSRLSREEMSRTLPRDFNLQTMGRDSQRRGGLPPGFKSSELEQEKPLPNPHDRSAPSPSGRNDLPWEMVPRSVKNSSLSSPRAEIPPTPPLDLPAAKFGQGRFPAEAAPRTYGPGSSNVFYPQIPSEIRKVQRKAPPSPSDWSSEESTPTPTASSVAAERSQAQAYQQQSHSLNLTPVVLTSPGTISVSKKADSTQERSQHPARSAATSSSKTQVESSSQQKPPNEPSRPMSVQSRSSSIFLPDGTEIPLQRTDLSKLTKITRSSRSGTLSSSDGKEAKDSSQGFSEKTNSGSGSRNSKEDKGKGRQSQEDSRASESLPSGLVSTEMERSTQAVTTPNIAGHLLAASPGFVRRRDGTSRPIYSPTPEKLSERRNPVASASNHPRTPLGEEAVTPAAPLLSTLRRFNKSDPSIATPESSRPGTGADIAQENLQGRTIDDLAINVASRRTFGPQATLFAEATKLVEMEKEKTQSAASHELPQVEDLSRSNSVRRSLNRNSFSSDTTAFDSPALGASPMMLDRSNSGKRRSFSLDGDRISFGDGRERLVSGMVAPPSDVIETKEPVSDEEGSQASDDTQFEVEENDQLIADTKSPRKSVFEGDSEDDQESKSRVIQIIDTREQTLPKSEHQPGLRPGTAQTRFSTRSAESQLRHGRRVFSGPTHAKNVACRQCFRAGFDCAMNLQLGEGTAGRKAFQEFVASGGLEALSVQGSPRQPARGRSRPGTGNLSISEALGDNYVDKLGEVKFGESALSRPVTRGVVDQMLEDRGKELAGRLDRITVDDFREQLHRGTVRSYGGEDEYDNLEEDAELDLDFTEVYPQSRAQNVQEKRRRSSLRTPPRGITPSPELEESELEEGEIPQLRHLRDRVLANQEDTAGTALSHDEDLDFLPDRWSTIRKVVQIGLCLLYIFSIEVVDSGYASSGPSILASAGGDPRTLISGVPSFQLGQAGGIMCAAGFAVFGRQKLTLLSVFGIGSAAIIGGFIRALFALSIVRGSMGYFLGVFILSSIGSIVDLFHTGRARLCALCLLLFAVAAGQISGPWITRLIIDSIGLSWPWLYWMVIIESLLAMPLIGTFARESNPVVVYRRSVIKLRSIQGAWTPEPRYEPYIGSLLRRHILLPYKVLFTHWTVGISTLTGTFFLGCFVLVANGVQQMWIQTHGFSPEGTSALRVSTVCYALGTLAAIIAIYAITAWQRTEDDKSDRPLHIDEKGFVGAKSIIPRPERCLKMVFGAAILFMISLYFIALTATASLNIHYLFSALPLVLLTASLILIELGILQYLLDSYQPARLTSISEIIAIPESSAASSAKREAEVDLEDDRFTRPIRPKSRLGRNHGSRDGLTSAITEADSTKESCDEEMRNRWGAQWALCAVAANLMMSVTMAAALSVASQLAYTRVDFNTLAVILASSAIPMVSLPLLLYRYGAQLRARALSRSANTRRALLEDTRKLRSTHQTRKPQRSVTHHSWQTRNDERPGGASAIAAVSRSSRQRAQGQEERGERSEVIKSNNSTGRKLKSLLLPSLRGREARSKGFVAIRKESISDPKPLPMALAQAHERGFSNSGPRPVTPIANRNSSSLEIGRQRDLRKKSYQKVPLSPLAEARLASRQQGVAGTALPDEAPFVSDLDRAPYEVSRSPEINPAGAPLASKRERARQQMRARELARSRLEAEKAKVEAEARGSEPRTGLGLRGDEGKSQDFEAFARWRAVAESKSIHSSQERPHFEYDLPTSRKADQASFRK